MATVGTKADDLALALEEAIVSGEIAPGTVLRQEQLSEQYQVSARPVREALRRLAALGLVSFVPNRGVRVRTLSREELREAFLVRAELESLATELATPTDHRGGAGGARRGREALRRADARAAASRARGHPGRRARRELGLGQPRLPRRHLRRRRRTVRRAPREERAAKLLLARRLGRRPRHRPPVRAERRSSTGRSARRSPPGSAAGRPRPRPRARPRVGSLARDDPRPGAGPADGRVALRLRSCAPRRRHPCGTTVP